MPQGEGTWPAWQPQDVETFIPSIVYGEEHYGWWVRGSSGTVNANCKDFEDRVDAGGDEGVEVIFPIFDKVLPYGGTESYYHVRILVSFRAHQQYKVGQTGCGLPPRAGTYAYTVTDLNALRGSALRPYAHAYSSPFGENPLAHRRGRRQDILDIVPRPPR